MDDTDLQRIWDTTLLKAWHDEIRLSKAIRRFFVELEFYGEDIPKLENNDWPDLFQRYNAWALARKIKRGLCYPYGKINIRTFTADYMPELSTILWNGNLTDKEILAKLEGSDYDIKTKRVKSSCPGTKEYQRIRKEQKLCWGKRAILKEFAESHNRRGQWGVTKPSASNLKHYR